MKIKGVSLAGLNARQMKAMRKHSKHHTAKHLRSMARAMKNGRTFTQAHKSAMKKVGR